MRAVRLRLAGTKAFIALWFNTVVYAAPNPPRSSVIIPDWAQYNYLEPEGTGTYAFGYDVEDPVTNNIQFRSEQRFANGTVTGSYGYLEPDGNIHMVHYVADKDGYRAKVEDSSRGGMLKPIPVLQQDTNYIAYGYTPQMLAAIKSQQIYKQQNVHEQRIRPFDQQSEEQKLYYYQPKSNENQKLNEKFVISALDEQSKLLQKLQQPFTVYP
ncbi:hypothetical protein ILUMI_24754 [Ignelater luminosus]|uniref:Uncharacterized protein n=1 Tax=Ignelater luminosus TaxID=2038154 RepID=A0A8K0G0N9_IGNLU|nr:hypothetical protein ILUMI_24754 [Ignelater luminosus]